MTSLRFQENWKKKKFGSLCVIKRSALACFSNMKLPASRQTSTSAVVVRFLPLAPHQTKHYGIFLVNVCFNVSP